MRRFLISFLILGLMAGSVGAAEAKKRKKRVKPVTQETVRVERTVEGSYGPYPAPVTGCNSALGPFSCLTIPTRPTEAFFTAKVTDAHGLPVFVEVDTSSGSVARFCGETSQPIRFQPGASLRFHVAVPDWGIQTDCPAHSVKTTGTISVTLSNVPAAQPLRSGTIVNGFWSPQATGPPVRYCDSVPECRAWLETGCSPALAGRDPAWTTSIEDIAGLADGSTPRGFGFRRGDPVGLRWGGVAIQFWRGDCSEIESSRWSSWDCWNQGLPVCSSTTLRIPVFAKWMTVSASADNANVAWTLT